MKARVRSAEILPLDGLNDWNDAICSFSRRRQLWPTSITAPIADEEVMGIIDINVE